MTAFLSYFLGILLWGILSWKMSLLVIFEILGLLIKTFTADDEYFFHNSEILASPIQIQLFKKQKKIVLIFLLLF